MGEQTKRALILSGGGGRGAYHCGVLEYLEIIGWKPDILVGTSIGAINSAAIASGHNAKTLKSLWRSLTTNKVQRFRDDLLDVFEWRYLLDNSPWRQSMVEQCWFDFDRINGAQSPTLAVTATDIHTGTLTIFCNRDLEPGKSGLPRSKRVRRVEFSMDHIIASCSIPVVYPWTEIAAEQASYWDGAVVSNTPLGTALRAGATEMIVVLLSPWGDHEVSASARAEPPKLWAMPGLALDWALLASFRSDLKLLDTVNNFVAAFELLDEAQRQTLAQTLWPGQEEGRRAERLRKLDRWRRVQSPWIIAPQELLPIEQIITYDRDMHEEMFDRGRSDAARILRSWRRNDAVQSSSGTSATTS